ncbi:PREDICTED: uncharacterized protein LOC108563582 [Nicrophorus vespilloides]|uniref:Uncharacterized protein LOC108563582 n=1 Tax=Nicrophorus vespilloides TaxID=110193 RepID=A0ABM1MT90_NICVS|nr:PREDICTED: uncharacterized protein LOC108563582 [Nicrophorus vespilloides]XP_017777790.1 PREDICTED: uncharacterized protein LOC108563582 [Nicrophorus vespilloides]
MVHCAVIGCQSGWAKNVRLRSFPPTHSPVFKQWVEASKNKNLFCIHPDTVRIQYRVCNLHFPEHYRIRSKFQPPDIPLLTENLPVDDEDLVKVKTYMVQQEVDEDDDEGPLKDENVVVIPEPLPDRELIERLRLKNSEIRRLKMKNRFTRNMMLHYRNKCRKFQYFHLLDERVKEFIECQLINVKKVMGARRYTVANKDLAVNIYKRSQSCFQYLADVFSMPSASSISKIVECSENNRTEDVGQNICIS